MEFGVCVGECMVCMCVLYECARGWFYVSGVCYGVVGCPVLCFVACVLLVVNV